MCKPFHAETGQSAFATANSLRMSLFQFCSCGAGIAAGNWLQAEKG
jgi:hypothetical protein